MKLAPKKRRNLRNFYLSIAAVIVIAGTGRYFAHRAEQERVAQQAELAQSLASLNAALPRKVDALTAFSNKGRGALAALMLASGVIGAAFIALLKQVFAS